MTDAAGLTCSAALAVTLVYHHAFLADIGSVIAAEMCIRDRKIIDTGIQNKGVEHIMPSKIKGDEYRDCLLYTSRCV